MRRPARRGLRRLAITAREQRPAGGDDLLSGDGSKGKWADSIDGGPGTDRIDFDWSDGAYDGRPGEGDDVRGVEKIVSSSFGRLVGTDAAEHLEVFQITGSGELIGHGGDDTLKGADGPDTLNGGTGADDLDAGFGDDHITGGPGADSIAGDRRGGDCGPVWCKLSFGNDSIDARDGERDSVTCGVGADTVKADPMDVVAGDCETVERTAAGAAGPAGPDGSRKAGRACVVPKLRGLQLKAAKRRLAKAGCKAKCATSRAAVCGAAEW